MNRFEKFFLYCSGCTISIIKRCPTERSKYIGIGATIFFTGLLASISAGYAFMFVFNSIWFTILFALIWGLMIFNLDRFIVLSMRKTDTWYFDLLHASPRILLAVLIALIISKPLELKIFEKEINTELQVLKQELVKERQDLITARYSSQLDSLKNSISGLQREILLKEQNRDDLFAEARKEADGTGGSGKVNPGPIYKIKHADAERVQQELTDLRTQNSSQIQDTRLEIDKLSNQRGQELLELEEPMLNGISFQLTALDRLSDKYSTIAWTNLFVIFLFIAIELAPILTKLISARGPYDDILDVHEHKFRNYRKEKTTISDIQLEAKLANI